VVDYYSLLVATTLSALVFGWLSGTLPKGEVGLVKNVNLTVNRQTVTTNRKSEHYGPVQIKNTTFNVEVGRELHY
jgi:hypothetical protein